MKRIISLPGDGIGPEIMDATIKMLESLQLPLEFLRADIGQTAYDAVRELLPKKTLALLEEYKIALKGPATTPIGYGFTSVNVGLRKHFDLYANIRPIRAYGEIPCPFPNVDLVIFRENTEDLYAGIEEKISDDEMHSIKIITRAGSMRIAVAAFDYAKQHGIGKVTVVTKANIMKLTDGLFLSVSRDVAKKYPEIELEEILIDNMCMQLVLDPYRYQVVLTENLYGDILSDLCAGLIGGIGLAPGANIGKTMAIFEPVHGSAPDIAGLGIANPTALFLSASMMLDYLGYKEGELIRSTLDEYLKDRNNRTGDLGGPKTTDAFTEGFIDALTQKRKL